MDLLCCKTKLKSPIQQFCYHQSHKKVLKKIIMNPYSREILVQRRNQSNRKPLKAWQNKSIRLLVRLKTVEFQRRE